MIKTIIPKAKYAKEKANYLKYIKSEEKIPKRPLSPTAYPEKKGD
jgi:hypothetical protein